MSEHAVLSWDVTSEAPAEPEVWVQQPPTPIKVCGGMPNVVVAAWGRDDEVYRHTPDGRLWRRVVRDA